MSADWSSCKNILCVRADNMGDVIMSAPAMRALKETFQCRITLLTSAMGALITAFVPEIDDTIVADLPWVKNERFAQAADCSNLIARIAERGFDAAVVFTVYSQNPLPAAFLLFMAGIPRRLAYCRENPYALLTHWVPDEEPYSFIRHQVQRDLHLVEQVGAVGSSDRLQLSFSEAAAGSLLQKLQGLGITGDASFMVMHPGVSEAKRMYPAEHWAAIARLVVQELGVQVVLTGAAGDQPLVNEIAAAAGKGCVAAAGQLTIEEWIAVIAKAALVVSVNTGTVHIAAAVNTPVLVLYALTNPQHTPWMVPSQVLPYSVTGALQSRNEVIGWVNRQWFREFIPYPDAAKVLDAIRQLLREKTPPNRDILQPVENIQHAW